MCVQITCEQVKQFTKTISSFHGKFTEEGPGTVGSDLDEGSYICMCTYVCMGIYKHYVLHNTCVCIFVCKGVKKLKKFQEEFAELEKERQELVNAEKLFDLPITRYSDLMAVDSNLQGMAKVRV